MIDIENGIVDFDIIKVCKTTKFEEFEALSDEVVEKSISKRGSHFYVLKSPIEKNGISMRASVFFSYRDDSNPSIEFLPYIKGDCRDAFNASHKWLESLLNIQLDTSNMSIRVQNDKLRITSMVAYDKRGGFEFGGSIEINFE